MKAILDYYERTDITQPYSEIIKQEEINAETEIKLFEQYYKLNNSLRYCNGSYYKFQNKTWEEKYLAWLKTDDYKKKSFGLFYSGSFVD